ncbi:MAG: hypothetical protein HKN44_13390 [Ilumatobacter sp.]|nr:hypothetical protein [Ilumatobacter sp.]
MHNSSRVWRHRPLGAGRYELVDDHDRIGLLLEVSSDVPRHATLARALVAAFAAHLGDDYVSDRPGVDWVALGWSDQVDHDALVADLAEFTADWSEHPFGDRMRAYVAGEKLTAQIPPHPPYTVDQLDTLDRIVRRAPAVVAQDIAAEGVTAA